jgi:hypothetical protein
MPEASSGGIRIRDLSPTWNYRYTSEGRSCYSRESTFCRIPKAQDGYQKNKIYDQLEFHFAIPSSPPLCPTVDKIKH